MQPISPVLTEEFKPLEIVYGENQPQYSPLPTLRTPSGQILTRWKPSDEEREAIMQGADILLSVLTFNQPLQPVRLEVAECDRDLMDIAMSQGLI